MNVEESIKEIRPYLNGEPKQTSQGIMLVLRESVVADHRKYAEIKAYMGKAGATCTTRPPGFLIPLTSTKKKQAEDATLLYLHKSDLEDGGPQPRVEIRPDDPATVSLFKSIQAKGQRKAIEVFPSPLSNGKYRIRDGHRRRMVIFDMLQRDSIMAISKPCSEQEAFEDAFILNYETKSLTDYELGRHLNMLMSKFPESYPTQEAVAQKVGVGQSYVSRLIKCFEEIERQTKVMPKGIMEKMPERIVREIRDAPEELKPAIIEQVDEKDLNVTETAKLVEAIKTNPEANESTVQEEATRIAEEPKQPVTSEETPTEETTVEEHAANLFQDAEKEVKRVTKEIDKLIEGAPWAPEGLVREVYARSNGAKLTQEKLNGQLGVVFDLLYEKAKERKEIDAVLEEAAKW